MPIQEIWEKALKKTEIVRFRIQSLETFGPTPMPYVFLAESAVNSGDTVVRRGEVIIEKPDLILPSNLPQFEGFEFEEDLSSAENYLSQFMLVRGIQFPSMKYENKTSALDIFEGGLSKALNFYQEQLRREENISTGLIAGPEDCWQFSVIIFVCHQVMRSADRDIKKLLEEYRRKGHS